MQLAFNSTNSPCPRTTWKQNKRKEKKTELTTDTKKKKFAKVIREDQDQTENKMKLVS